MMSEDEISELLGIKPVEDKTAIIDGDFLLYIATYPFKVVKEDGTVEYVPKSQIEVFRSANEIIVDILSRLELRKYIGLLGYGGNFRYDIFPEYKSNRKERELPIHFKELKDYLCTHWKFEPVTKCEVDDAVISYAHHHTNTIIVSPDKDVLMTTGNHYNPMKKIHVSTTATVAHEYFWKSMIVGDSADGIKGLVGKGQVYANRMWDKYSMKLGYTMPAATLEIYIDNLGEEQGVIEFNKNYRCLKISNEYYKNYEIKNYEGELNKYEYTGE